MMICYEFNRHAVVIGSYYGSELRRPDRLTRTLISLPGGLMLKPCSFKSVVVMVALTVSLLVVPLVLPAPLPPPPSTLLVIPVLIMALLVVFFFFSSSKVPNVAAYSV